MEAEKITIVPLNKQLSIVNASENLLDVIREKLSFYVKGYKYMPLYRKGFWDGKTYLFNVNTRLISNGLVPMIERHFKKLKIEVERESPELLEFDDTFFLEKVACLTDLEIMDHQLIAIEEILTKNFSLILSPTSSGKSLILYLLAKYVKLKYNMRSLIIVPNIGLVAQMHDDMLDYANDGWNSVHQIYGGQEIMTEHDVVVSTYQSAVKLEKDFYDQFGLMAVDEAHGATSKSITNILSKTSNASFICGLTGTLDGTYLHEIEMLARFGDLTKVISTKELMVMGKVATLNIECARLVYPKDTKKLLPQVKYKDEIDFIVNHQARNEFIVNLATSRPDINVLVLFNLLEHGEILKSMIEERMQSGELFFVNGDIDVEVRKSIRGKLETSTGNIFLASYGTSSVGTSIKNLHWMILAHPFKGRVRVLQTIGRILRISPTKSSALVTDIGDHLFGKEGDGNILNQHFNNRLIYYKEEEFECQSFNLEI